MNPEEIVNLFVTGVVTVVLVFVLATLYLPSLANLMDLFLTQIIAGLVYLFVIAFVISALYQLVD